VGSIAALQEDRTKEPIREGNVTFFSLWTFPLLGPLIIGKEGERPHA
jgi:hypothetical protein